jgi:hypothetical protein
MTVEGAQVTAALLEARDRTAAAISARVSVYTALDTPLPSADDKRGEGVAEIASRRCRLTEHWATDRIVRESRERDGRVLQGVKSVFATSVEVIFDGGRRYIRTGATWRCDDGPVSGPRQVQDPMWQLDALAGANEDAVLVADSEVPAVTAAHSRLTVDLRRASERLTTGLLLPAQPRRRLLRRPTDQRWQASVPAEVWIDADGLVRRISIATLAHATRPGEHTLWFITEFDDFGVAAEISIPAARDQ